MSNRLLLIVALLAPSLCSCVALHELRHSDRVKSTSVDAWGEVRRDVYYVLKQDMFLNGSELNYNKIVRTYRPGLENNGNKDEKSLEHFDDPMIVEKGTLLRFTTFIVYRRIWGSMPTVSGEIINGPLKGKKVGMHELVVFEQSGPEDYIITEPNEDLIREANVGFIQLDGL